jgi:F-type H+-transporting ATPase subunit gamma
MMRYIESQVYRAVVENLACEMAARMVAMKSATDNAEKISKALAMEYNRARQTQITTELMEIMGGVEAMAD